MSFTPVKPQTEAGHKAHENFTSRDEKIGKTTFACGSRKLKTESCGRFRAQLSRCDFGRGEEGRERIRVP